MGVLGVFSMPKGPYSLIVQAHVCVLQLLILIYLINGGVKSGQ